MKEETDEGVHGYTYIRLSVYLPTRRFLLSKKVSFFLFYPFPLRLERILLFITHAHHSTTYSPDPTFGFSCFGFLGLRYFL